MSASQTKRRVLGGLALAAFVAALACANESYRAHEHVGRWQAQLDELNRTGSPSRVSAAGAADAEHLLQIGIRNQTSTRDIAGAFAGAALLLALASAIAAARS